MPGPGAIPEPPADAAGLYWLTRAELAVIAALPGPSLAAEAIAHPWASSRLVGLSQEQVMHSRFLGSDQAAAALGIFQAGDRGCDEAKYFLENGSEWPQPAPVVFNPPPARKAGTGVPPTTQPVGATYRAPKAAPPTLRCKKA